MVEHQLSGKIVFIHLQIGTGCQQDDRNFRQTSKSKQLLKKTAKEVITH